MMELHKDSHLDHGLTREQVAYLVDLFKDRSAFFIETVVLPEPLGTVPCGLHEDVPESEVHYARRGVREYDSRLCRRGARQVREVTVVAGPHEDRPCIAYTMYGGPQAPREPGDPDCKDVEAARAFWSTHALTAE